MVKSPVNATLAVTSSGKPFHFLLAALLAQMLVSPFIKGEGAGVAQDLVFLCLMGAALRVVRQSRLFPLILCLALVCGASIVAKYLTQGVGPSMLSDALGLPVIFLTAVEVTRYLARQKRVDLDTVLGGLCVYLFLGAMWFTAYSLVERLMPGSFDFTVHGDHLSLEATDRLLFFFSYVTLLTMGYGDIVPLSPLAQTLAVVEGVAGQFYLVFFMARLVGLHVAEKQ
ncbi:potassium channel family protein [Solidesulfovibrio sp.]|uniref:potassium channel family protein n=1 Tax=Solidesulfovibrio sp. TaxID=2910990 RepID=UPI00261991B2|nr:potassium channel family protein [Solidesulfovibrio sp.]